MTTTNSRHLCFNLGPEEYSIPLLTVKEVIGLPEITSVPQSPPYFLGIMNLRGQVISVVDLRLKLSIKPTASEETSVVILDMGELNLGVVVDKVNSVHMLSSDKITEKPILETKNNYDYILGVFRKEERIVMMLDPYKSLSIDDKKIIGQHVNKKAS